MLCLPPSLSLSVGSVGSLWCIPPSLCLSVLAVLCHAVSLSSGPLEEQSKRGEEGGKKYIYLNFPFFVKMLL